MFIKGLVLNLLMVLSTVLLGILLCCIVWWGLDQIGIYCNCNNPNIICLIGNCFLGVLIGFLVFRYYSYNLFNLLYKLKLFEE